MSLTTFISISIFSRFSLLKSISLGEDVEIEMKPLKGKEKAGADGMAAFLVVAEEINGKVDEVKKNVEDMRKTQRLIISEPSRAERDK